MMATLLLRLAGPLQSWGVESKFETRRTLGFPTKSGVIGLLAAALGYSRDEPLEQLDRLHFGIRIEREGVLLRDYHVARAKQPYTTERFYLADAMFLAGLESDDIDFLNELNEALYNPAFPLYLGRRSCVPIVPLSLGIRKESLLDVLRNEPWHLSGWLQNRTYESDRKLRIIADSDDGRYTAILQDVPISFSRTHREFAFRPVQDHGYVNIQKTEDYVSTEHDALSELNKVN